jgi:hypothetical protein
MMGGRKNVSQALDIQPAVAQRARLPSTLDLPEKNEKNLEKWA